jgi:hypothetical protein
MKNIPDIDNGFIYILSNSSFPSLFKVGYTASDIRLRLTDLNSTGVPNKFKIECLVEIPKKYLRGVEAEVHERLSLKKLHHSKEFFNNLEECKYEVLETIKDLTGKIPDDYIKEYKARETKIELEKVKKFEEEKERERIKKQKEGYVNRLNKIVDEVARHYCEKRLGPLPGEDRKWLIWIVTMLAIFILATSFPNPYIISFLPIICAGAYILYREKKRQDASVLKTLKFPQINIEDIESKSEKYRILLESIIDNSRSDEKEKLRGLLKIEDFDVVISTLEKKIIV